MASPSDYLPGEDGADAPPSLDLSNLWRTLIEKSWVILICLAIAAAATYYYLKRAPVVYASTVTLSVDEPKRLLAGIQEPGRDDTDRPEDIKTIVETLKSRAVIDRVIETNKLATDPRVVDPEQQASLSRSKLIARVSDMISPHPRAGTRLIDITVQHSDPLFTEQLANAVAKEFLERRFEQQLTSSDSASLFYRQKEQELLETNRVLELEIQQFKDKHPGVGLEEQTQLSREMVDLNQRIATAGLNIQALDRDFTRMSSLRGNVPSLLNLPAVNADPAVAQAFIQALNQENSLELVKKDKKPKHPDYIKAQTLVNAAQAQLTNTVLKVVDALESRLQAAKAEEAELRKTLENMGGRSREVEAFTSEYKMLVGKSRFNQELLERISKDRRVTEMSKTVDKDPVRVEQKAIVPERPIKPNRKQIVLMGVLAGLLSGVGLAFALAAADPSLKSADQAEKFLKLPLLGVIPQIKEVRRHKSQIIMTQPKLVAGAESFRSLRTTLSMLGPAEKRRTFLFTSAVPEEGKTFCTINFAFSRAQQGLRTLLIDCDLRCPTVEQYLVGKKDSAPGVAEYLSGKKDFKSIVNASSTEHFSFIAAGQHITHPSELLAQPRFKQLLDEALEYFDQVVVDSAPIHPVSDTLLLARHFQTVCFVVRADRTPRKASLSAVQKLLKAHAPVAGFILNGISPLHRRDYYDYTDYYQRYRESRKAANTGEPTAT